MIRWQLVSLVVLAAVLVGCTKENPAYIPPEPVCGEGEVFSQQTFSLPSAERLDILVVADRMESSQALRGLLGSGLGEALADLDDVDWQLGVISSDLTSSEHDAFLQPTRATGECAADEDLLWEAGDVTPERLACRLTSLGAVEAHPNELLGSAQRALRRALSDDLTVNRGLLRPNARTLILLMSPSEDCSGSASSREARACLEAADDATSVEELAGYLSTTLVGQRSPLAARPTVVMVGGPAGELSEASCEAPGVTAGATPRLRAAAQLLGDAWWSTVCTSNLGPLMREAVAEVASPAALTVCLGARMIGGPRSVSLGPEGSSEQLSEIGDYLVEPAGELCANGGVSLNGDRLSADGEESLRIRFCRMAE